MRKKKKFAILDLLVTTRVNRREPLPPPPEEML